MQRHGTGCQTSPDLPHHGNMASWYYSTTIESNFFQFFFFFWTNLFHVHHITLILKPPSTYKLHMIKQAMFACIHHLESPASQARLLFVDFSSAFNLLQPPLHADKLLYEFKLDFESALSEKLSSSTGYAPDVPVFTSLLASIKQQLQKSV